MIFNENEEINIEKIKEEITRISYNAALKTLLVWVKDNPYFDKVHYTWLNSEEKVETFKNMMVKFTNDKGYTRANDALYYNGRPVRKLEYELPTNVVKLGGFDKV